MKLPTVKNFLFCLSLESGGLIIGWIAAVVSCFGIIGMLASIIMSIVVLSSDDAKDPSNEESRNAIIGNNSQRNSYLIKLILQI